MLITCAMGKHRSRIGNYRHEDDQLPALWYGVQTHTHKAKEEKYETIRQSAVPPPVHQPQVQLPAIVVLVRHIQPPEKARVAQTVHSLQSLLELVPR